jgi:hypothetical protein
MVPNEISFIKSPTIDLLLTATRLPPQDMQRIPRMVRFMMILSKSSSAMREQKCKRKKGL